MSPCTILIPTSPIPSMPFTTILSDTIERIRAYPDLAEVPIVLMADGVGDHLRIASEDSQNAGDTGTDAMLASRRERYEEYKRNLRDHIGNGTWKHVELVEFKEHTHQAGMARAVISELTTPLILTFDHGTYPVGPIPWADLFRTAQHPDVNSLRLYNFDAVHEQHTHLFAAAPELVEGVLLLRTIQFSGRPNLCKRDWYERMIEENLGPGSKCFLEDILWPVCSAPGWAGWDEFKLWIYAPPTGYRCYENVNERGTFPIFKEVILPGSKRR